MVQDLSIHQAQGLALMQAGKTSKMMSPLRRAVCLIVMEAAAAAVRTVEDLVLITGKDLALATAQMAVGKVPAIMVRMGMRVAYIMDHTAVEASPASRLVAHLAADT